LKTANQPKRSIIRLFSWAHCQRGIDNGALAQRQTSVTQIAIDHGQDAGS
jgi:hypothetical protein